MAKKTKTKAGTLTTVGQRGGAKRGVDGEETEESAGEDKEALS
jgi:hypothetical protein